MEARLVRAAVFMAALTALGASHRTANFIVQAPTPEFAREVGQAAENLRRDLAIQWTGQAMPNWAARCPITVRVGPSLGAGGATSFVFELGEVFRWQMSVQGTRERILDSVLPHEITHTVFATHFRAPLPRWADEGACTTVEHISEKSKQKKLLVRFLKTGRGISFSRMFAMKEYPSDVLPLYSQGYSLARFLIASGNKREFMAFVGQGMKTEDWSLAVREFYGDESLRALQDRWLDWVRRGSPDVTPAATLVADTTPRKRPDPNLIYRAQSADRPQPARPQPPITGRLVSVPRGWVTSGSRLSNPRDISAPTGEMVASSAPTREQHQAVRPQYPQRPQQIIIVPTHTGSVARAPQDPPPSVYDTRAAGRTRLR